jgi:protein-L-isoaspartate(D-aspartate) O-methyltransferase
LEDNESMIRTQIEARGVRNPHVLAALRSVDRAQFVPVKWHSEAYADCALPIEHGQTISQPYIVGFMTELLDPRPEQCVLEVGCGTGYQTAVLSKLAGEVWSLEIVPELADAARQRLAQMGFANVHVIHGDAWRGLPEQAPFDRIIVTAAPEGLPPALIDQLRPGGRLVVPVGLVEQELMVITKDEGGNVRQEPAGAVRFVPMVHGRGEQGGQTETGGNAK